MATFWELFKSSVIVQSLVTLLLVATICYLYITQAEVPDGLYQLSGIVVGFWLGSKASYNVEQNRQAALEKDGNNE